MLNHSPSTTSSSSPSSARSKGFFASGSTPSTAATTPPTSLKPGTKGKCKSSPLASKGQRSGGFVDMRFLDSSDDEDDDDDDDGQSGYNAGHEASKKQRQQMRGAQDDQRKRKPSTLSEAGCSSAARPLSSLFSPAQKTSSSSALTDPHSLFSEALLPVANVSSPQSRARPSLFSSSAGMARDRRFAPMRHPQGGGSNVSTQDLEEAMPKLSLKQSTPAQHSSVPTSPFTFSLPRRTGGQRSASGAQKQSKAESTDEQEHRAGDVSNVPVGLALQAQSPLPLSLQQRPQRAKESRRDTSHFLKEQLERSMASQRERQVHALCESLLTVKQGLFESVAEFADRVDLLLDELLARPEETRRMMLLAKLDKQTSDVVLCEGILPDRCELVSIAQSAQNEAVRQCRSQRSIDQSLPDFGIR